MKRNKKQINYTKCPEEKNLRRMMCVIAQENINTAKKARETMNM